MSDLETIQTAIVQASYETMRVIGWELSGRLEGQELTTLNVAEVIFLWARDGIEERAAGGKDE